MIVQIEKHEATIRVLQRQAVHSALIGTKD